MTRRRWVRVAATLLVTALAAGCAATTDAASTRALSDLAPVPPAEPTTTAPLGPRPCEDPDYDWSLPPLDVLPAPGAMPAGTPMAEIQNRGVLRVGVDESTKYFSSRSSAIGEFEGFEPALARLIADAIFGEDGHVRFVPVVTDNKVHDAAGGEVDMTIDVVSKSCDRWREVDFSSTYYETSQKLMVRTGSDIDGIEDLEGRKVCVTAGSSSQKLADGKTEAVVVPVAVRTDCLVALQEGTVDAVLLPHSILVGLQEQAPTTTTILPDGVQSQSYGIAMAKDKEELVGFVNALLERWRTDGTLDALQAEELDEKLRIDLSELVPDYRTP